MVPTITIEEVYDLPKPPPEADPVAWDAWIRDAKKIGEAVVEECGNITYRTTFEGPNRHHRAKAFANFALQFQWLIEVAPPELIKVAS